MNRLGHGVFSALTSTSIMAASSAWGQSAATSSSALEEIVVTAQKREQSITDVGMSISAVTGDTLKDLGVSSFADLNKVVAGLSVTPPNAGISGAPVYTLRGIGFNEKSLSALSAVSFYSDEVPLPYVYMTAGPSVDIERVEVLKGPQGTLYGQNSTGGAINYIANKPTDTFEAGVEASYGRFNTFDANGYVSGPLGENVRARAALRSVTADGWQESRTRPGDELGAIDQLSARVLLDVDATDALRFQFNLNGWRDRSEPPAAQLLGFNPSIPVAFLAFYPFANELGAIPVDSDDVRKTDWTPGNDYTNDNEFGQSSLRAEWDVSEAITLTSITAYSHFEYQTFHDIDGSATAFNDYDSGGKINSFSQELRLSGDVNDQVLWITGVNYSKDRISASDRSFARNSTTGILVGVSGAESVSDSEREGKAIFASADYEVIPTVTVTAGARYTEIDLDWTGCTKDLGDGSLAGLFGAQPGGCVTTDFTTFTQGLVQQQIEESNVSWRGGVNWKPIDDTLLYATISRGFKSGDFPTIVALDAVQYQAVTQEKVTAYEVGLKQSLLEDRLQVNAAVFHYDYKDKQLYAFVLLPPPLDLIGEQTINIPESKVDGAELEITVRPILGLTLRGAVGYTKTEIKKAPPQFAGFTTTVWPPAADFLPNGLTDIEGDSFNLAPEWQGNVDAQYTWTLGSDLDVFVGASGVYASSTLPTIGASDAAELPSYTTVDARLGVGSSDGTWRATLWGRNVTDETYAVGVARGFDITARFAGMPRTYGVTLGYNFK